MSFVRRRSSVVKNSFDCAAAIRYLRVLFMMMAPVNEERLTVKKIGIMTSGGDCPGLNAVIRAVVRRAMTKYDMEAVGILRGWLGLMDGLVEPLSLESVSGILPRGGTILRTSRTNPFIHERGPERIMENFRKFELDALIAIGGEDTMGVASRLHKERGLKIIGVPKAIDNDVWGTEYAFGFDTTCNIAMEAIDRIHTTAESHDRVMVIEVMGRDAGWIALYGGLAGGADMILIPERPVATSDVCELIRHRHDRGKDYSILVVAEGTSMKDPRSSARVAPCRWLSVPRPIARSSSTSSAACQKKRYGEMVVPSTPTRTAKYRADHSMCGMKVARNTEPHAGCARMPDPT
jgi:6-phosphofructokinase